MAAILLVEDDPVLVEGMREAFIFHDHRLFAAGNGPLGLRLLEECRPDLAILDVMLPGADGFAVCRQLRDRRPDLPVIFLTARSNESDKLLGFASGADDYLTKPFSMAELLARVGALLKRCEARSRPAPLRAGSALIDLEGFTVRRGDDEYALTPKERDILKLLVENPDRVFSRDEILDRVWGEEYSPVAKTVDNFILKLRAMIEDDPRRPRHILSLHGAGYKFRP
jgi:DNA-binding response OmpR family regulator